jgi:hypothetical protein
METAAVWTTPSIDSNQFMLMFDFYVVEASPNLTD